MIPSWILFTLLVGTALAVAARCLEEISRIVGAPLRWIWAGALLAFIVLVALAPLRASSAPDTSSTPLAHVDASALTSSATAEVAVEPPGARLGHAWGQVMAPIERGFAVVNSMDAGFARGAGVAWAASSLLMLLAFLTTARRYARRRRTWPTAELAGTQVRISPDVGPAVVGLLRPEIVVPRWVTHTGADEQRLVLLHEREHLRARDPAVLAVGCLAVTLIPWHPAAWWMLLRLRMAVELDCDRRVLGRGVRRLAYGSLLIDVAGRGSAVSLGAPALGGKPNTLKRRLSAMTTQRFSYAPLRVIALAFPALALLAIACDAPPPTAAEIEAMDVAAEKQAERMRATDSSIDFARALFRQGEEIIELRIATEEEGADDLEAAAGRRGVKMTDGSEPFIVIDGERADASAFRSLRPEHIESVELIKGAAAVRMVDDPAARNGVVRIETKDGTER